MNNRLLTLIRLCLLMMTGVTFCVAKAQTADTLALQDARDTLATQDIADDVLPQYDKPGKGATAAVVNIDSLMMEFDARQSALADSLWTPDADPYFANYNPSPAKAVWYAALFPGGGQIYNRKYWKLPIIYGGYLGLIYGYRWNQKYYRTYANSYRDLVLNSPAASYMDFLPPNYPVKERRDFLEKAFKRKRNFYRMNRDYCLVGMIGIYLVAMVDAYVDASLYHFDVSTNLDANNHPTLMLGYTIDF
ncbi:MAG: hypothetical protein KBT20_08555 [Bacteroidales bacterium]|nr:hypothetical protein [Candidatus Liminaster caballi]